MSLLAFIAVCASLLATPGPTNTLLATSGAEIGWRRSAALLAAELLGYLLAIAILRLALGPFIASRPIVATALQAGVALYLVYLATALWQRSSLSFRWIRRRRNLLATSGMPAVNGAHRASRKRSGCMTS